MLRGTNIANERHKVIITFFFNFFHHAKYDRHWQPIFSAFGYWSYFEWQIFRLTQNIFLKMCYFMFHFMSSLVTWDVVILVLIILKTHVWSREILHFESKIVEKNRVTVWSIEIVPRGRPPSQNGGFTYRIHQDKNISPPLEFIN